MTVIASQRLIDPRFRQTCRTSAILMYVLILVTGSIPGARADIGELASGAVLHSTAYAVLACLWFLSGSGGALRRSVHAVLAVAVMGAGDEFVQSFFPYRHADVRDWAVDCTAALLTTLALSFALRPTLLRTNR